MEHSNSTDKNNRLRRENEEKKKTKTNERPHRLYREFTPF
jgi:hypothetical protein